ncbi:HAD family hydrolase [Candidatus Pacearchaeota archaeon]|nr:HAD family hydrolase [Candidatus Pacearchaeota archaeon]
MIEAIIFDFDMTLVNFLDVGNKAIEDLRNKHGLFIGMTEKEIWGTPHIPLMKNVAEMNQNKYSWEEISEWNKNSMHHYYKECNINDLDELIEIKEKGIYFGIVSNNSKEVINEVLNKNGNDKLKFGDIFGNEDFKNYHSKSEIIQLIVEKYDFNKNKVMYVGDSEGDVIAAKEAGVISVAVVSGLHTYDELKNAGSKIIIENLRDIAKHIDSPKDYCAEHHN